MNSIDTPMHVWRDVFQVNFFAPIMLARGLFKELAAARGSIVNVTSIAGTPRPSLRRHRLCDVEGGARLADARDGRMISARTASASTPSRRARSTRRSCRRAPRRSSRPSRCGGLAPTAEVADIIYLPVLAARRPTSPARKSTSMAASTSEGASATTDSFSGPKRGSPEKMLHPLNAARLAFLQIPIGLRLEIRDHVPNPVPSPLAGCQAQRLSRLHAGRRRGRDDRRQRRGGPGQGEAAGQSSAKLRIVAEMRPNLSCRAGSQSNGATRIAAAYDPGTAGGCGTGVRRHRRRGARPPDLSHDARSSAFPSMPSTGRNFAISSRRRWSTARRSPSPSAPKAQGRCWRR